MTIPYTITQNAITIYTEAGSETFHNDTIQYRTLKDAILRDAWDEVSRLVTKHGALRDYLPFGFTVDDNGVIRYEDVELPATLGERINSMAANGDDPVALLSFYERLHNNPSFRSREQVFQFLQHLDISIEPDGTFLAYKGVNEDYTDCHTSTFLNAPGEVHEMARNLISDDPQKACHAGFHVGAREYAESFGRIVVICRVDPADVVCVPYDSSCQKMRVCRYEVVGEWSGTDLDSNFDSSDMPDDDIYNEYEDVDVTEWDQEEPTAVKVVQVQAPANPLDNMSTRELMDVSIEDLRRYATHRLKIVGASKVPGGKATLVAKIVRIRRRQLNL